MTLIVTLVRGPNLATLTQKAIDKSSGQSWTPVGQLSPLIGDN